MSKSRFDHKMIEEGVELILKGVGEDINSVRMKNTPGRVTEMLTEVLACTNKDPADFMKALSEERHDEMVILKDIPLYSMCEHHLLPFFGTASIAYIPREGKIIGLNTLAKLVDSLSRRLQIQERLTKQIADSLVDSLSPLGVMVVIKAEHLCMTMRGAKKPGSTTMSSAVRGIFRKKTATRQEAMSLIT